MYSVWMELQITREFKLYYLTSVHQNLELIKTKTELTQVCLIFDWNKMKHYSNTAVNFYV